MSFGGCRAAQELAEVPADAAAQHLRGCAGGAARPRVALLLGLAPHGCWLLRRLDHHHHDVRCQLPAMIIQHLFVFLLTIRACFDFLSISHGSR